MITILISCSISNKNTIRTLLKNKYGDRYGNESVLTRKFDIKKDYDYDELIGKAEILDTTLDFFDLRMAYYKYFQPAFRDTEIDNLKGKTIQFLQKGEWQTGLDFAQQVLQKNYVEIESHLYCSYAYLQLGDTLKSDKYRYICDKLLESIFTSGDGETPETAYLVINVSEEYVVLRSLGLMAGTQALTNYKGQPIDVLIGYNPETKKEITFHFNVTLSFMKMEETFKKKKY